MKARRMIEERGAATVEFFVAIPLVLFIGMAGLEFARIAATSASIDAAAHAAARTVAATPAAGEAEARAAALAAVGSLDPDKTTVEVSVSTAEPTQYTHRLPNATGTGWTPRDSQTERAEATATVKTSYKPTTPLGATVAAALGSENGEIGFSATAKEKRDATVEGGSSSW